jgi:hypothetical protein
VPEKKDVFDRVKAAAPLVRPDGEYQHVNHQLLQAGSSDAVLLCTYHGTLPA